jgi:hypothetical protein
METGTGIFKNWLSETSGTVPSCINNSISQGAGITALHSFSSKCSFYGK